MRFLSKNTQTSPTPLNVSGAEFLFWKYFSQLQLKAISGSAAVIFTDQFTFDSSYLHLFNRNYANEPVKMWESVLCTVLEGKLVGVKIIMYSMIYLLHFDGSFCLESY